MGTASEPTEKAVVPFTLVSTMTVSAFQIFALAVLASRIIKDLDISRTELGLLGSINTVVGALSAPWSGRLTDRIGPRLSIVIILGISGTGLSLMALSTNVWLLAISAMVSGIPQGWGNSATNALIVGRVAEARRGVLTGIKQSGVQVGAFLSGLLACRTERPASSSPLPACSASSPGSPLAEWPIGRFIHRDSWVCWHLSAPPIA
ncbi:MAG: MFS family permease [Acidimicrobiales bacterium]